MNRRGVVYPIAWAFTVFLMIASASLIMRGIHEVGVSERSREQSVALHLAEAGVDQAARNLRTPTDANDDATTQTYAAGAYQITAQSNTPPGSSSWTVRAVGTSGQDASSTRTLEVSYQLTPQSVFQFAVFGDTHISVSGSAITDSYDSGAGPYSDATKGHNGDIGTNTTTSGGVAFTGSNVFVDGQVAVGPDVANPYSVVTGYNPLLVTGGTSPPSDTQDVVAQSSAFPLPDVVVPPGLTCSDLDVPNGSPVTLSPTGGPFGDGTYCYRNLKMNGGATLTATGAVTVYLTGELSAQGNSTIGVVNDPTQILFLLSSTAEATIQQTITGNNTFYGAIYGPDARIRISGSAEVFGSIIAKTIDVTGNAVIHYDEALTEVTDISNTYKPRLVSWREL